MRPQTENRITAIFHFSNTATMRYQEVDDDEEEEEEDYEYGNGRGRRER